MNKCDLFASNTKLTYFLMTLTHLLPPRNTKVSWISVCGSLMYVSPVPAKPGWLTTCLISCHRLCHQAQITNYNHSGLEAKPHKPSLRQSYLIINPNGANGTFHRAWLLKKFFEKLLQLQITTPRCLMIR